MTNVAGEQPITPTTASATGTWLQQGDRLMLMPPAAALKATINA